MLKKNGIILKCDLEKLTLQLSAVQYRTYVHKILLLLHIKDVLALTAYKCFL